MTVHFQNNKVAIKSAPNSTTYTLTKDDCVYTGYSGQTINLPAPSTVLGYRYVIKAPSDLSSTITVNASTNSSTIDGQNTHKIYEKNDSLEVVATSSGWSKISQNSLYICQGRLSGNQTVTNNVDAVLQFQNNMSFSIDPQGWLNNSTYRFQPTIAGYYHISLGVWFNTGSSSSNQINAQIRKNTNSYGIAQSPVPTTVGASLFVTSIIDLNGSTDYVEFTVYSANPSGHTINGSGSSEGTYFTAIKV